MGALALDLASPMHSYGQRPATRRKNRCRPVIKKLKMLNHIIREITQACRPLDIDPTLVCHWLLQLFYKLVIQKLARLLSVPLGSDPSTNKFLTLHIIQQTKCSELRACDKHSRSSLRASELKPKFFLANPISLFLQTVVVAIKFWQAGFRPGCWYLVHPSANPTSNYTESWPWIVQS